MLGNLFENHSFVEDLKGRVAKPETKKARVTHFTHDPHKQKKFLRQANLGEDIEDDVLGGAL